MCHGARLSTSHVVTLTWRSVFSCDVLILHYNAFKYISYTCTRVCTDSTSFQLERRHVCHTVFVVCILENYRFVVQSQYYSTTVILVHMYTTCITCHAWILHGTSTCTRYLYWVAEKSISSGCHDWTDQLYTLHTVYWIQYMQVVWHTTGKYAIRTYVPCTTTFSASRRQKPRSRSGTCYWGTTVQRTVCLLAQVGCNTSTNPVLTKKH